MPSRCLATRYASLRVPQCSVFSILPPFSAQVCSMTVRTFLISSSGVAGRTMKTKSYKRSSMMTSFHVGPAAGLNPSPGRMARQESYLLLFLLLRWRHLPSVVLIHRRVDALCQDH